MSEYSFGIYMKY
ncbi:Protein of unknown function [Bacillus cereus]|nr:Protein of unknown function [Bacillus cereus]SCN02182.1 Protein of unknown function [Bacillus wiedmannii]SCN06203.1 Protein of unknown function [Bacillus wiedmannii]SCN32169.1 Protein of unknown function [Bacillus wiedmannii]SCN43451.1 Protein of unknown function [Bacillus cereus]